MHAAKAPRYRPYAGRAADVHGEPQSQYRDLVGGDKSSGAKYTFAQRDECGERDRQLGVDGEQLCWYKLAPAFLVFPESNGKLTKVL